ncbi:hypothetical protein CRG98_012987 [Punica granatum]|uniref:CCHC-type domain-containing protein n=1 Tax=Punica granatum TaxID=22663 RepID=A0A2I0KDP2_PUNGR|nr:hypothetical protein CRG98_012987 [Punica granatum]
MAMGEWAVILLENMEQQEVAILEEAVVDFLVPRVVAAMVGVAAGSGGGVSSGGSSSKTCHHCGKIGHIKSRCWALHGFPTSWGRVQTGEKGKQQPGGAGRRIQTGPGYVGQRAGPATKQHPPGGL